LIIGLVMTFGVSSCVDVVILFLCIFA